MPAKQTLNLLVDVPREIRDEIYSYAFQTPYNCVTYRCTLKHTFQVLPYDPQNDLCLSESPIPALGLLCTCKQLYNEAIISLWKINSLGLWPADLMFRFGGLSEDVFMHIQSLEVNIDLIDPDDLKWMEMLFLRIGGKWSIRDEDSEGKAWGALKTVQVNVMRAEDQKMDVQWMQRVAEALHLRWQGNQILGGKNDNARVEWALYWEWIILFRKAGKKGDAAYLGDKVKKVMTVNTAWDGWTYWEQKDWVNRLRHGDDVRAMEELMEELNDNFGGELWVNGGLCYKDNERIRKAFEMKEATALVASS